MRIKVQYALKIASEKHKAAEAAFESYLPHCPAAQSVIEAIDISHAADYEML